MALARQTGTPIPRSCVWAKHSPVDRKSRNLGKILTGNVVLCILFRTGYFSRFGTFEGSLA